MDVLVTGAFGRCETAIVDPLHDRDEYDFAYFDCDDPSNDHPYGDYESTVGDVAEYVR